MGNGHRPRFDHRSGKLQTERLQRRGHANSEWRRHALPRVSAVALSRSEADYARGRKLGTLEPSPRPSAWIEAEKPAFGLSDHASIGNKPPSPAVFRARISRVAGCVTPTGSAGHAGATANLELTFHPDRSAGGLFNSG